MRSIVALVLCGLVCTAFAVMQNSQGDLVMRKPDDDGMNMKATEVLPFLNLVPGGFGQFAKAEWVNIESDDQADLSSTLNYLSCVDGRRTETALSVPGGDMGEFITGLGAFITLRGVTLTDAEIEVYFANFMATLKPARRFYYHIDTEALDAVSAAAGFPVTKDHIMNAASNTTLQALILPPLTDVDNLGCAHIETIAKYTTRFNIAPATVSAAVRAFFKYVWFSADNAKRVVFEVLTGHHTESAWIEIEGSSSSDALIQPAFKHQVGAKSAFIYQTFSADRFAETLTKFFYDKLVNIPTANRENTYKSMLYAMLQDQLAMTKEELAITIPWYHVFVDDKEGIILNITQEQSQIALAIFACLWVFTSLFFVAIVMYYRHAICVGPCCKRICPCCVPSAAYSDMQLDSLKEGAAR